MLQRCSNPRSRGYERYGGRGIKVCKRWRENFVVFLADVGPRPSPRHTLDRIKNNRGYTPSNVQWATRKEQQRNRDKNRNLTIQGITKCVAAWAEEFGINRHVVRSRLNSGWHPLRALKTPVGKKGFNGHPTSA